MAVDLRWSPKPRARIGDVRVHLDWLMMHIHKHRFDLDPTVLQPVVDAIREIADSVRHADELNFVEYEHGLYDRVQRVTTRTERMLNAKRKPRESVCCAYECHDRAWDLHDERRAVLPHILRRMRRDGPKPCSPAQLAHFERMMREVRAPITAMGGFTNTEDYDTDVEPPITAVHISFSFTPLGETHETKDKVTVVYLRRPDPEW